MARTRLDTGSVIDGIKIGSLIHKGGMANIWDVTRRGDTTPLLMKIPVLREGEDPAAIAGFEMEQMIMPRLKGPHVPRFVANGDFSKQPYIVMERIPGETLLPKLKQLPLPAGEVAKLGALMYFFASGERPFGDPQRLKGLKRRLWRDPVPPRQLRPDLPPWFQDIVLRCLEVHAGRRHPTAAQLAFDLRNPEQVALTARAGRVKQDSFFAVLRRKFEPELSLIDRPIATAADAILDYARVNTVDHIVMGARENSTLRKILGSVSAKVAAEAPCSVTVVRKRHSGS